MYLENIDYYSPDNMVELLQLLEDFGEKANVLAGGTDLILQMKLKRKSPSCLIDIKSIEELNQIYIENDCLVIGCGVTLSQLWKSETVKRNFPALWKSIQLHADRQIRNRGTIVGNICNASPAAETPPPLLTYDTLVEIQSSSGRRDESLEKFFVGPGVTTLKKDEVVTKIYIPMPPLTSYCSFQKLSRVYDDIATINAAARIEFNEKGQCTMAVIFMGAVGPVPMRAKKAENLLLNQTLNNEIISEVSKLACEEATPITDVRASDKYRKKTMNVLIRRALENIQEQYNQAKVEMK